jgi:hypothetical protein
LFGVEALWRILALLSHGRCSVINDA